MLYWLSAVNSRANFSGTSSGGSQTKTSLSADSVQAYFSPSQFFIDYILR
jgi:hypothetical protein